MSESKQNKLVLKKLTSNNSKEVLFTINKLRNTGNKNIIPILIDLLATNENTEVKEAVVSLFYDLKYQSAAPEIINALKSDKYLHIREELLTVCWQSSLDFSNYVDVFIEIFINGSFKEAFEAFTTIDNVEEKIDAELVERAIVSLKNVISNIEENKKELLLELVHILEVMKKL